MGLPHLGETVGSNAFNLLFNSSPLLRSKYKKFLLSLWIQAEFHRPKHFLSGMRGGTGTLARFEKVKTVLKFTGSAVFTAWFSRTVLNFFWSFYDFTHEVGYRFANIFGFINFTKSIPITILIKFLQFSHELKDAMAHLKKVNHFTQIFETMIFI